MIKKDEDSLICIKKGKKRSHMGGKKKDEEPSLIHTTAIVDF